MLLSLNTSQKEWEPQAFVDANMSMLPKLPQHNSLHGVNNLPDGSRCYHAGFRHIANHVDNVCDCALGLLNEGACTAKRAYDSGYPVEEATTHNRTPPPFNRKEKRVLCTADVKPFSYILTILCTILVGQPHMHAV